MLHALLNELTKEAAGAIPKLTTKRDKGIVSLSPSSGLFRRPAMGAKKPRTPMPKMKRAPSLKVNNNSTIRLSRSISQSGSTSGVAAPKLASERIRSLLLVKLSAGPTVDHAPQYQPTKAPHSAMRRTSPAPATAAGRAWAGRSARNMGVRGGTRTGRMLATKVLGFAGKKVAPLALLGGVAAAGTTHAVRRSPLGMGRGMIARGARAGAHGAGMRNMARNPRGSGWFPGPSHTVKGSRVNRSSPVVSG